MPFLDQRAARPQRAARAHARGRAPLRALRRREPDQRPEPRAHRGAAAGARRPRAAPAALLGQPQLAPVPRRHAARDGGRRRRRGRSRSSPRPTARTRAAASTSRTSSGRAPRWGPARPSSTSCASSTTTPASSRPTPTSCARRSHAAAAAPRRRGSSFTAHSIPLGDGGGVRLRARSSGETCGLVAAAVPARALGARLPEPQRLAEQPWLEPDILDHLARSRPRASRDVVVAPDRLRVRPHGGRLRPRHRGAASAPPRSASASCAPRPRGPTRAFVRMIRELVEERVAGGERRALGARGPRADTCAPDCCASGAARPAAR